MTQAGENLPSFRAVQLEFAAHIRNPAENPKPGDVEERRMAVYRELFYNNIEGFLAGAFPVAKKTLGEEVWHALARKFVHQHASESPYFLEISQEFLAFLDQTKPAGLPDFLLELCHYEWVELRLRVDAEDIPTQDIDPGGDLLDGMPVVSPLCWALVYQYPVHQLGVDSQPTEPPDQPTYLLVYRNRSDQVRFMESNPLTHRLLDLLDSNTTGSQALAAIMTELNPDDPAAIHAAGAAALAHMATRSIILGTSLVTAQRKE